MPNRWHLLAVCLHGRGSDTVLPFNTLHMGTRPRHDDRPSKGPPPQSSTWGLVLVYGFWWDTTTQIRQLQHVPSPLSMSAQPHTSLYISPRNIFPSLRLFFLDHLHEAMASVMSVTVLTTKHWHLSSFLASFYYEDNWKPQLPTSHQRWRLSELPLPPPLPTTMTKISVGSITPSFSSIMFTNITIIYICP